MKPYLKPFWNEHTANLSSLLWSPTLDNCSNIEQPIINSWVHTIVQKQSHSDPVPDLIFPTDDTPETPPIQMTRKIKLFPNINDAIKLSKMFGASRYIYNHGLLFIQDEHKKYLAHKQNPNTIETPSTLSLIQKLRIHVVQDHNYLESDTWMLDSLPQDTRDSVIREMKTNYINALKTKHSFTLTFRSKKHSQTILIRQRAYHAKNGFYSFLRTMRKAELFPDSPNDLKIQYVPHQGYYLIISYPIDPVHPMNKLEKDRRPKLKCKKMDAHTSRRKHRNKLKNQQRKVRHYKHHQRQNPLLMSCGNENQVPIKPVGRTISLDAGVRTFATGYTPDGYVYHLGVNDNQSLYRLFYRRSKLQSRIARAKGKKKRSMRRALKRASTRIRNLVDDCHKKLAKWLFDNFQTVILPKLNASHFKKNKYIRIKMGLWRHCSFVERLRNKQHMYPPSDQKRLIVPTEEYTSKTCSHCGHLNHGLGSSKIFSCPNTQCQRVFDRDVNSGLNILLKYQTECQCHGAINMVVP